MMSEAPETSSAGTTLEQYALDAMILARCRRPLGHEMKNSVQGLYSGIEILNKAIESAGKSRIGPADCVPLLRRQLDGLQEALQRILDDVAPQHTGPVAVDIVALVRDVVRFLMSDAAVAGVRVELDVPKSAMIRGRAPLVRRVVLGFFLDAIDAVRGGGTLKVGIAGNDAGISIQLRDSRGASDAGATSRENMRIDTRMLWRIATQLVQEEGGTLAIDSAAECVVTMTLPASNAATDAPQ